MKASRIILYSFGFLSLATLIWLLKARKPTPFGMNVHTTHLTNEGLQGMKNIGVSIIREEIRWTSVEPSKGDFEWGGIDAKVNKIKSYGIDVLLIIDYGNPWASGSDDDRYVPPEADKFEIFKKSYGDYVYEIVSHYKGKVKYFEIWNEPDIQSTWRPEPNAKQYTELLKEAYTRAKQADQDCVILSAGLSHIIMPFFREMYENGIKDYCDILGSHPYLWTQSPNSREFDKVKELRDLMLEYGDDKEIWFTEFGYPTSGENSINEKEQAEWFAKKGAAINLGSGIIAKEEEVIEATDKLLKDRIRWKKMSDNGKELIDGRGLERIVNIIKQLQE